jgi:hypothetical protein
MLFVPLEHLRPVDSRFFSSGLEADGISVSSSALLTVWWYLASFSA